MQQMTVSGVQLKGPNNKRSEGKAWVTALCQKKKKTDGEEKLHVAVNVMPVWCVTHLAGVVIIQSNGAELRGDAAALGEGGSAVPVRALFKLVRNSDLFHRGRSCPNNDLREQSGVKHEPSKGQEETHDQKKDQG